MKTLHTIFFVVISLFQSGYIRAEIKYQITIIDVGEGDSILIQDLQKSEAILIDTGTALASEKIISVLKNSKIKKLKSIIITHPHPDHFGGIFGILSYIKPENYYDNGEDITEISKKDEFQRYYIKSARSKNYRTLSESDKIRLGEIELLVLSSFDSLKTTDWNTNSLSMILKYKNYRMLLMGDGNFATEKYLVDKYCKEIKSSALKAGHHGTMDTASEEFLKCVKPDYVFVSVEKDSASRHPPGKALENYKRYARNVILTSQYGDIVINLYENGNSLIE